MKKTHAGNHLRVLICKKRLKWKIERFNKKNKKVPETYVLKESVYASVVRGGIKCAPSNGIPGARSIWQGLEAFCSILDYRNYRDCKFNCVLSEIGM